jgi:hypothetical protein
VADPIDEAAARLYGLPLEDFTRERDALARELRKAKERDTAAVIAKLPKPSQAAWAANTLARERRDLVDDLLAAGDALREAQDAALSGGGADALRDAAAAERRAVDALVTAAKELRPSGRKPSETTLDRLRNTLHAAAGDDDVRAALDAGRLVEDAQGGSAWGLFAGPAEPSEERPAAQDAVARGRTAREERDKARARDVVDRERKTREERAREREERAAAEQAERERRQALEAELREARAERRARERELQRAEREAERAAQRLEAALAAAEEAREAADEARTELDAAREAAGEARDAAARLEEQLD